MSTAPRSSGPAVCRVDAVGPAEADTCDVSITVPLHNEEENVEPMFTELRGVLESAGLDYEMIFVDDGSTDDTLPRIRALCAHEPRAVVIELRRNFGQTAAMAAGFDHARGRVIVPMDGDMQNDPRDIPKLLKTLEEGRGYDVVSGWRKDRQDTFVSRKLPSRIANWLIGRTTRVRLHDYGCTLKAYRREIIEDVCLYSELHRFLPALAAWNGARVTEVPVNHRARTRGETKYGLSRTFKVMLDLITVKFLSDYMVRPLAFFTKLSLYILGGGAILLAVAIGQRFGFFYQPDGLHLNRNILVALASLCVILSANCFMIGLLGELLVRIFQENRGRPAYRIRRIDRASD